jgi:hypothetical protein
VFLSLHRGLLNGLGSTSLVAAQLLRLKRFPPSSHKLPKEFSYG